MIVRTVVVVALLASVACTAWSNHEAAAPVLASAPLPWVDVAADASVAGVVRAAGGAPVAGARVCAWHHAPLQLRQDDREPRCVDAGADGSFAIDGLVPAAYFVNASAPSWRPRIVEDAVVVRAGQRREGVQVALERGGALLRGRVVDVDGAPIAGAWVGNDTAPIGLLGRGAEAGARSDADGRFGLWLAPGTHRLVVDAAGFVGATVTGDTSLEARVVLGPAATIGGGVFDAATGAPIAGARVLALREGLEEVPLAAAYTDAGGSYTVSRLAPGRYRLRAEVGHRRGEGDRAVTLGLGEQVTLPPIAMTPLPGVQAIVEGCGGGRVALDGHDAMEEAIGPDGEVFVPSLAPGEHRVDVRCYGAQRPGDPPTFTHAAAPLAGLRWPTGAPASRHVAEPAPPRGEIRGVVVDGRGQPVVGAEVGLFQDWWGPETPDAISDARGMFALHAVGPGPQTVSAHAPGQEGSRHLDRLDEPDDAPPGARRRRASPVDPAMAHVEVVGDGVHEVRLTLPAAARPIRGRVMRDGAALAGAVVAVRRDPSPDGDDDGPSAFRPERLAWNDHQEVVRADEHGRFTLTSPFAGARYVLWAYPRGGGDALVRRVEAGADVVIDVPARGGVAGALPGPAPLRFGVAVLDAAGALRQDRVFEHTGGRWAFDDLDPGRYQLRFVAAGLCVEAWVDVVADEVRPAALAPGELAGVRGRVVDGDDHLPEADAEVVVRSEDPRLAALEDALDLGVARTDADGRFELPGRCPGPVTAIVRTPLRDGLTGATLVARQYTEVPLVLRPTSAGSDEGAP